MTTPSVDGVSCTVQDGEVLLHLDDLRVSIPSRISNQSQILLNALTSACDSSATESFTLKAPIEYLQAWVACFVTEEQSLGCADSVDLVRCLMVRFKLYSTAASVFSQAFATCQLPDPAHVLLRSAITSEL
jgi:hypothetical protein